ncbi:MAG: hypothetical protein IJ859_06975 [Synergistaceae bacterium]|nr:hypothetical protein [Synergistaceae bacterium]MBR2208537.1 hypothetical protein [Synergistaceae bacterium]
MNNYEGTIKREKMLANFSNMIKSARIITGLSHEELAKKSGLSAEFIIGVEEGLHRFHEAHYLALAAVFDNVKYSEDSNIYKALLRILTPEDEIFKTGCENDFVLVRRWFETFNEDFEAEDESFNDNFLEDLAVNYDIYADSSAIEDENFPALVSRLEPLLIQNASKIFVPSVSVRELEEDIELSKYAEEKLNLREVLEYIKAKNEEGLISILESPEDFDDTEEMLAETLIHSPEYEKIAIITQDFELAENLTSEHQNVTALHISDTGDLILWRS